MQTSSIYISLLLFLFIYTSCCAKVYHVGSTKDYTSPNKLYTANVLEHGDTVEIDAEEYIGIKSLAHFPKNNLLIRGVGGKAHMIADGVSILNKGIWVLSGNDITVENIEFSGASVADKNGAGIRLDGIGLTVRRCFFHENENGILTSNPSIGKILIEYSEFANNGFGDGFSHNVYIGRVDQLIFQFNYSHHAHIGHNLKSRARENFILYNRISDEVSGNSSRLIDLPNGGFSIIMGNVLMQGKNSENKNAIGYGLEGFTNSGIHKLSYINNTIVSDYEPSCTFLDIADGSEEVILSNSIFAGEGQIYNANETTIVKLNSNIKNNEPSLFQFVDTENYNYNLKQDSPAIDVGSSQEPVMGISLTPEYHYKHPAQSEPRILVNDKLDVGAYEYINPSGIESNIEKKVTVYPNPTSDYITFSLDSEFIEKINIYNSLGQLVDLIVKRNKIDLSALPTGLYYIVILNQNGNVYQEPIMKE